MATLAAAASLSAAHGVPLQAPPELATSSDSATRLARTLWLTVVLGLGLGCAPYALHDLELPSPGRLALILEDAQGVRSLRVLDELGTHALGLAVAPRDIRFIDPHRLLLIREEPAAGYGLPDTVLSILSLPDGSIRDIDGPRQHFDPEPSPDGRFFSVGVERASLGDSDFEIWELSDAPERIASRAQALDEARWSPDGRQLVASRPVRDGIETEGGLGGGGFGGISIPWPRLFLLRRDLGTPSASTLR